MIRAAVKCAWCPDYVVVDCQDEQDVKMVSVMGTLCRPCYNKEMEALDIMMGDRELQRSDEY